MTVEKYIASQTAGNADLISNVHDMILSEDKNISAAVGPMMGSQMIIYSDRGAFKYALGSTKKHISLHLLPMYCEPSIREKYLPLLPKAQFQKGCINFTNQEEMPSSIVRKLIRDCSNVDVVALREKQLQKKKTKA